MADQTTTYVVQVSDRVDPAIEKKLRGVSMAATSAAQSCTALQRNLDSLNAAGLTGATQAMRDANVIQRQLATTTTSYARTAVTAATNTTAFATALPKLATNAAAAWAEVEKLRAATTQYAAGARAVASVSNQAAQGFTGVGTGGNVGAAGVRGMNSALGLARGNITSANRLAGVFLSTLIGSGPIVQAAFQTLGALALVAVLAEVVQAVYHVVQAYRAMQQASAAASIQAIEDGEKRVKIASSIFTAENAARFFAGRKSSAGEVVEVQQVAPLIAEATATQAIARAQREVNEAGLKGAALQRQKRIDAIADVRDLEKQRDSLQKVADSLKAQRLEQVQSRAPRLSFSGENFDKHPFDLGLAGGMATLSTNKITDAKAIAEIEKNFKGATEEVKRLNTEIKVMNLSAQADEKREGVAQIRDEARAARLEMAALNVQFKDYVASLTTKLTPQLALDWWKNAGANLKHPENQDQVTARESSFDQQIAARNDLVSRKTDQLNAQISSIGEYDDALKIKNELDRISQEIARTGQPLNEAETAQFRDKISYIVKYGDEMAALNAQYKAANGPQQEYEANTNAIIDLWADGAITGAQFDRQMNQVDRRYRDSIDPMAEYQRGLANQTVLLGKFGRALTVATELQGQQERLRGLGYTDAQIAEQTAGLEAQLTVLERQKEIHADMARLYASNAGALDKLTVAQEANAKAYQDQIIGAQQYKRLTIENAIAQNQLQNEMGKGNVKSQFKELIGSLIDARSLTQQAQDSFKEFFTTINKGFADAIGHAIAYGGSVKEALLDVARQAVAGLISSLIQLGEQYLLLIAAQKLFGIELPKQANNASDSVQQTGLAIASIAAITAVQLVAFKLLEEPAWSLAEAISLISFGANAVAATAGIAAVVSAGDAAKHFAAGGYVSGAGTSTSDSIPARLSHGEYVVNAQATAQHYAIIDAINHGGRVSQFAAGGYVAGSQLTQAAYGMQSAPIVNVIHDGSTAIDIQPGITPGEVRVIARSAVYEHADDAIGRSTANPNSQTRKGLRQHTGLRGVN